MGSPFLAEIRIFSFGYAPRGWAFCNGQILPINQNQALFSLLGTTYGGNGQTTFALPNLQGRVPIHFGNGHNLGEVAGEISHTLIMSELPAHNHLVSANSGAPNVAAVANDFSAALAGAYSSSPNAAMLPGAVTNTGGSQPHQNMSPFLTLNICICLQGIFPSRN